MEFVVLTKVGGLLGPFAWIFGQVFNLLYELLSLFTIENVAVTVVLFTIVTKLLMTPMTVKQQKFSKLQNKMSPELTALNEKYKNKRNDEKAMRMMQIEQQAIYEKYGTSPTAGCLPMLIMFPIMFALYKVIYAIPAYVPDIYELYNSIAEGLKSQDYKDYFTYMKELAPTLGVATKDFAEMADNVLTNNHLIDIMTKFSTTEWDNLITQFPSLAEVASNGVTNIENIEQIKAIHSVGGFNILNAPQDYGMSLALLIPVLAIVTQLFQSKLSMSNTKKNNKGGEENAVMQSMNSLMYIMPFMSGFMCWMFPICVGIYWVASTVVTIIYQFFINRHIDKMSLDEMIQKNVEKQNKKREKLGIEHGSKMAELAKMQTKSINTDTNDNQKTNTSERPVSSTSNGKKSISGYANMLKKD